MSQERSVTYVSGLDKNNSGGRTRTRTLDPLIKSYRDDYSPTFLC